MMRKREILPFLAAACTLALVGMTLALILGVILYVVFTLIDVDIIAERRELLLIFSAIFILLLFPFGDTRSGNRSWLDFSFLPFSIQPAEICKIPFIMILAKTMSIRQNKISHISTVLRLAVITVFMFGLIVVASEDLGVALQYLFIFVIMAFVGGVSLLWFLGAGAVLPRRFCGSSSAMTGAAASGSCLTRASTRRRRISATR